MTVTLFNPSQLSIVTKSLSASEELVSDHYKVTTGQWLRHQYDVFTLKNLEPVEMIDGPLAQVIKYTGAKKGVELNSATFDYYKICLMDNTIIKTMHREPDIGIFPFLTYILTHELIHIIRFGRFIQHFHTNSGEKVKEEIIVHGKTREILEKAPIKGMDAVFKYYKKWLE